MKSPILGLTASELAQRIEDLEKEQSGIRGDYCSKYGIIKCRNGLISYSSDSRTIVVKNNLCVKLNDESEREIGSDLQYTIQTSNTETHLLFNGVQVKECDELFFQNYEPQIDATKTYFGWYNPDTNKWLYKQGYGQWFDISPYTVLADLKLTNSGVSNVSYVGYRHLDSEIFLTEEDVAPVAISGSYNDLTDKPNLHFTHIQDIPSNEWTIQHHLGWNPSIVPVNSAGKVIVGAYEYPNTDTAIIKFNLPYSGKAYLS